jgi:hypothetical protein
MLHKIFLLVLLPLNLAFACDPCALYNSARIVGHTKNAVTFSISEQYTDFKQTDEFGENSIKNGELVKGFSTTQLGINYDLSEKFGIFLSIPVIGRNFDKINRYRVTEDTDIGIGDTVIGGNFTLLNRKQVNTTFIAGATLGIKLPTGDTGVIEDVSSIDNYSFLREHPIGSSSGGRALTFGTGSYDYIIGGNILTRYEKLLLISSLQYTIRTEGDFNYKFANDLITNINPGYYLMLDDNLTIASGINLSGEFKEKDQLSNKKVSGSQFSNIYVGPNVLFTVSENITGEALVDFRVSKEDSGASVVPDTRVRLSFSYMY